MPRHHPNPYSPTPAPGVTKVLQNSFLKKVAFKLRPEDVNQIRDMIRVRGRDAKVDPRACAKAQGNERTWHDQETEGQNVWRSIR